MKVGWVLATRTPKNAFFEFFLRRLSTTQPPALPVYPAGRDPSHQRTRTSYTSQAAAQTVQDAGQTTPRTDTHAQKLDTLHRYAPDTRQAARGDQDGAGGLEGAWCVRQTTLFRMQNIFHANVYKCCLCNLTFPWIHV